MVGNEQRAAAERPPSINPMFREVIALAAAGNNMACQSLFESYQKPMARVVHRRLLPVGARLRSELDAEDLMQDTWLSVFDCIRRGRRFRSEPEFWKFVFLALKNQFRTYWRKRVKAQQRTLTREEPLDERRHGELVGGSAPAVDAELAD